MVFQISYDLVGLLTPPEVYQRLETAIKSYGVWMHFQKSEWFIETALPIDHIATTLGAQIRPTDRLMIVRVTREWRSYNLTSEQTSWLNTRAY